MMKKGEMHQSEFVPGYLEENGILEVGGLLLVMPAPNKAPPTATEPPANETRGRDRPPLYAAPPASTTKKLVAVAGDGRPEPAAAKPPTSTTKKLEAVADCGRPKPATAPPSATAASLNHRSPGDGSQAKSPGGIADEVIAELFSDKGNASAGGEERKDKRLPEMMKKGEMHQSEFVPGYLEENGILEVGGLLLVMPAPNKAPPTATEPPANETRGRDRPPLYAAPPASTTKKLVAVAGDGRPEPAAAKPPTSTTKKLEAVADCGRPKPATAPPSAKQTAAAHAGKAPLAPRATPRSPARRKEEADPEEEEEELAEILGNLARETAAERKKKMRTPLPFPGNPAKGQEFKFKRPQLPPQTAAAAGGEGKEAAANAAGLPVKATLPPGLPVNVPATLPPTVALKKTPPTATEPPASETRGRGRPPLFAAPPATMRTLAAVAGHGRPESAAPPVASKPIAAHVGKAPLAPSATPRWKKETASEEKREFKFRRPQLPPQTAAEKKKKLSPPGSPAKGRPSVTQPKPTTPVAQSSQPKTKAKVGPARWSAEEMRILEEGQAELGNNWEEISRRLPGRTRDMVNNRW